MLAKPVDERYQGGHEVGRDLRQCEQQLGVNINATQPRPVAVAGLASGAQPELALAHAEAKVIAQTVDRTRGVDVVEPAAPDAAAPAHGVSHSFDSLEATQRLAVLIGSATAPLAAAPAPPPTPLRTVEVGPTPARSPAAAAAAERQTATQAIGSIPRPAARSSWRRRDWLLVGGATLAGMVVAGVIFKRRG
jgi:hypothetical protein